MPAQAGARGEGETGVVPDIQWDEGGKEDEGEGEDEDEEKGGDGHDCAPEPMGVPPEGPGTKASVEARRPGAVARSV